MEKKKEFNIMARNQLPEGVGKKIVEALKRQAETDTASANAPAEDNLEKDISVSDDDLQSIDMNFDDFGESAASSDAVSDSLNADDSGLIPEIEFKSIQDDSLSAPAADLKFDLGRKDDEFTAADNDAEVPVFKAADDESPLTFNTSASSLNSVSYSGIPFSEKPKKASSIPTVHVTIPANVAVLKGLVASLPAGVTKQTGAQIIRQTVEAMGLPMANVLKEAQELQEQLNNNTRECMLKIQEFKTDIMQLERSVQEYQKNITQINDLVSLFLLTDRK